MRILQIASILPILPILAGCAGLAPALGHPGSPLAWRDYWLEQYRSKLVVADLGPSTPVGRGRTVLLVPGMTISADFFGLMAQRLERDGFHPVIYEDRDLLTTGVVAAAQRLAARVNQLEMEAGGDKLDIVAECVGGVTARYYVEMLGGDRHLAHVVTFVSPHHGSWPAFLAAAVTSWQGMRDIRTESALLTRLDRTAMPDGVSFTSIYSCSDDLLLPHHTAWVPGAINVELCRPGVDHFAGFWDRQVYEQIREGLTSEAAPAPPMAAR